jgi:hypothetical protein
MNFLQTFDGNQIYGILSTGKHLGSVTTYQTDAWADRIGVARILAGTG